MHDNVRCAVGVSIASLTASDMDLDHVRRIVS